MQDHDHQYQNAQKLSRTPPPSGATRLEVTMAEYMSLISALSKHNDRPIVRKEACAEHGPVTLARWVR